MGLRSAFDVMLASEQPLALIDDLIWQNLVAGARSNKHPWNEGCFSTVEFGDTGTVAPRTRTVILRRADRDLRTIDLHTDVRSAKIRQLDAGQQPAAVCWLFYQSSSKIQLRLEGTAELINDQRADAAWQQATLPSRSAYLSIQPPGLVGSDRQPPDTSDRIVTAAESERGRDNFRIIRTTVRHVDWLYLRRGAHVRAHLDYQASPHESCRWVVP